jgi:hypothetical protein
MMASPAGTDKLLQNQKGTVTYQNGSSTKPLARNASVALADSDIAQTGASSLAAITLPDSSRVLMGSNSSVTLSSFNQTTTATAKFVVVGKVRFQIEHPAGAAANYTFQTQTGQIAVRGTIGDIFANPSGGLQVNVYALSNPALPVQVTLVNGQVFTLAAGQSLVATAAGTTISAGVSTLSHALTTPFSELGSVPNAGALGLGTTAAAAGTTATAAAAAGVAGAAAAGTIISNSNKNASAPTPTPVPLPSTTAVPITVQSVPASQVPRPHVPGNGLPRPRPTPPA